MTRLSELGVGAIFIGVLLAGSACSDDDVTQVCGNDLIEGPEQCDGIQVGGNDCTTVGANFTGGTLACTDHCGFDTSGCTTGEPTCGDNVIHTGEDCDDTNLGGQVCTDVGNYIGGTLACATDCTWDVSSCDVPLSCGNDVIDTGEDCDGTHLGGQDCTDVGDYNGGTLACATDCTWEVSDCGTLSTPSEQIAAVRAAPDATGYSLDVDNVLVTYLKPALGDDPAGFVVQADPLGPALFVRAEPTSLSPIPAPGDEVRFTVSEVGTHQDRVEALAISGWLVHSAANPLAHLVQRVSDATDLVSGLDGYEVELITLDGTVVADFEAAGADHLEAVVETDGIVGETDLRLRLPATLTASLALGRGCTFTVTQTPLWRDQAKAQVVAYDPAELTVHGCPAPRVVSAMASGDATVVLSMDRPMDETSITNAAAQLSFTGGLTATAATVNLHEITVTTSVQTPSATYDVTVAGSVTDTLSVGVDPSADTATFTGFAATAEQVCDDGVDNDNDGYIDCLDTSCIGHAACTWGSRLYLWELDADQPSTDATEYVELWNNTGAPIDFDTSSNRYFVLLITGSDNSVYGGVRLTGNLPAGEVYVIGVATVPNVDLILTPTTNAIQNGPDGILLVQCNDCTDRSTDFPNAWVPAYSATPPHYTSDDGQGVTWIDALAYETSNPDDPDLWTVLNVTGQYDEEGGPNGVADNLQRTSPTSWAIAPPTPGITGFE
jgi:hypothetical protein